MLSPKKERGRPMKRKYPPRIDATPDEFAQAMFRLPADHEWQYQKNGAPEYRCAACGREVLYPDTLHRDGRCENCRTAS